MKFVIVTLFLALSLVPVEVFVFVPARGGQSKRFVRWWSALRAGSTDTDNEWNSEGDKKWKKPQMKPRPRRGDATNDDGVIVWKNKNNNSKFTDDSFGKVKHKDKEMSDTRKSRPEGGRFNRTEGSEDGGSQHRRRKVRQVETFADVVTQPDNFYRTLSYDHLATNSLRCIETMPHFRFDKGDSYLRKWWFIAKKWGLLTGELKRLDDALTLRHKAMVARAKAMKDKEAAAAALALAAEQNNTVPMAELYSSCEGVQARVICIGDVHGCCAEVTDLLRSINYHPGDLVLFLGDLVAKGPASTDVIRLAIDLGALSVRGNHDHEVVRQGVTYRRRHGKYRRLSARKDAASSHEHLRVALDLNLREFNWLAQLPYYICSVDLGMLFVHAGFQQKVKLMDQDPWVMMTMRSLLPDGRVSARCIYTQPWADRWAGPMSVIFGHDAARGLQVRDHAVGLDSGCVYGGNLTALLLPERRLVSVPARETYTPIINSRSHKNYVTSKDRTNAFRDQDVLPPSVGGPDNGLG